MKIRIIISVLILISCRVKAENFTDKFIENHANISDFLKDLERGLQSKGFVLVIGKSNESSNYDAVRMNEALHKKNIVTTFFLSNQNDTHKLAMEQYLEVITLFICHTMNCEEILHELEAKIYIRRSFLYMFYWGNLKISDRFLQSVHEAMKIVIITNPRSGVFRLYYNQASSQPIRPLPLVNWWSGRMYRSPALPSPKKVYNNFNGRTFKVPVFHVPPWHFVRLFNDSAIEVVGGRDHQLLNLLAEKLNFKYEYFDPPDHSQGSGVASNGSFRGVLGIIYRREADFFLGDVTMTWERQKGVEFSFFTLADSGAFLTHAPRRLSEALALLRPFRWEVWPAVVGSVLVAGPALWAVAAGAALWRPHRAPPPPTLARCIWFTTSIFLRQSGRAPSCSLRVRALTLLLSLAATYVLGDVYSATLTSLLARPGCEPPITDLFALERAMKHDGYSLLVERHSSSLAVLQNGSGVYGRLWHLMEHQRYFVVRSVEQGVRRMLQNPNTQLALLAGRETLYFDTRRFGAINFQLSEKLYTRYSAIALQLGCPYVENFNNVLMQLFEAGILTKITSEEYEKLGESGVEGSSAVGSMSTSTKQDEEKVSGPQSTQRLEPINMRMVQGAFYVLAFGYLISGLTLIAEIELQKRSITNKKMKLKTPPYFKNIFNRIGQRVYRTRFWIRTRWQRAIALSDLSLEYIN